MSPLPPSTSPSLSLPPSPSPSPSLSLFSSVSSSPSPPPLPVSQTKGWNHADLHLVQLGTPRIRQQGWYILPLQSSHSKDQLIGNRFPDQFKLSQRICSGNRFNSSKKSEDSNINTKEEETAPPYYNNRPSMVVIIWNLDKGPLTDAQSLHP